MHSSNNNVLTASSPLTGLFANTSQKHAKAIQRPKPSLRYVDPPDLKANCRRYSFLNGLGLADAADLQDIQLHRRQARKDWAWGLHRRAASGDWKAHKFLQRSPQKASGLTLLAAT